MEKVFRVIAANHVHARSVMRRGPNKRFLSIRVLILSYVKL